MAAGVLFLSGFLVSWLLTRKLAHRRGGGRFLVLDQPGPRSLHSQPTPRTGGLALWAGFFAGLPWLLSSQPGLSSRITPLAALVMVAVISFQDDRKGVTRRLRLGVQLAAALLLLADTSLILTALDLPDLTLPLGPLAGPFSLLFVLWFTNLYNFMDGMDGLAGGMGVIGFGAFAWLGWAHHPDFAMTALLLAACCLGFLMVNFPPARIFMGDVGSVPLGFAVAAMILWGVRDAVFPLWAALLIFSPFWVDATVTLLARLLRGEKVWQAHRSHYYQRLVGLGWSHRRATLLEYALMTGCALSAVWFLQEEGRPLVGVAAWALGYLVGMQWIRFMETASRK